MEAGKACTMKAASFTQPLQISAGPGEEEVTVALTHAFWNSSLGPNSRGIHFFFLNVSLTSDQD